MLVAALAFACHFQSIGASVPVDEWMGRLRAKYEQLDKKYDALAGAIEKQIAKDLKSIVWLSAEVAGSARTFAEHPSFELADDLARAARAGASGGDAQSVARRKALLARFPWIPRVELDVGLDGGSDRPIPENVNGFIDLGMVPDSFPGFPELTTNQYLFGLQEIVGWRAGVKPGKEPAFEGRDAKRAPGMETSLPGYERIRVLLQGTMPEVPLFALPQLTHAIHGRLAERRRGASPDPAEMDERLALLDSKWDGFLFDVPWSKERFAVVQPIFALMADRKGFFYRFGTSARMAQVGDLPFISIQTLPQFAKAFLGKDLARSDFVRATPEAKTVNDRFLAETNHLVRYRRLIDTIVRAVLCPNARYPEYLGLYDYAKDEWPGDRGAGASFDVARKHAVLLWAHAGRDPIRLADWLFDRVLDREESRFPEEIDLCAAFTTAVRREEAEMLQAVAARIAGDRKIPDARGPGDFEREFSPYPTYLELEGEPSSELLLASFHAFHESAAKLVRSAALAAVEKEAGK